MPTVEPLWKAPPVAFHFCVTFGSSPKDADGAFEEVSGIGPEVETESVVDGGENRFAYQLPKAMKHPRLKLRRGIAANDSRLVLWCKSVLEGGFARPVWPRLVNVFLLDAAGDPLRVWSFDGAWPVKWETGPFNATKNELALETVELVYAATRREV